MKNYIGNTNGFKKGMTPHNKGKKASESQISKSSISHKKYYDKAGRSDIKRYHHNKDRFYVKWRMDVFGRDDFKCQGCEQIGGSLQAHHIKGWAENKDLRYDIDNGITLCIKCHKELHKKYGKNL